MKETAAKHTICTDGQHQGSNRTGGADRAGRGAGTAAEPARPGRRTAELPLARREAAVGNWSAEPGARRIVRADVVRHAGHPWQVVAPRRGRPFRVAVTSFA